MIYIDIHNVNLVINVVGEPRKGGAASLLAFITLKNDLIIEDVCLICGPLTEIPIEPVEVWVTNVKFIYRWWERELLRAVAIKRKERYEAIRESVLNGIVHREATLYFSVMKGEKVDDNMVVFSYKYENGQEKGKIVFHRNKAVLLEVDLENPYYISWLKKTIGEFVYYYDTREIGEFVSSGIFDPFLKRRVKEAIEIYNWYARRGYPIIIEPKHDKNTNSYTFYPIRIIL